jgi:hypothetical protein
LPRRIKTACFTGGEPFYDLARLKELCAFAVSCGLIPTVVTNAFWADSEARALATLRSLPGLRVISISTDQHHLRQIPFERVANALKAANELGWMYNVAVCTEDEHDPDYCALLARLEQFIDREKISTVITFPAGRALKTIGSSKYEMTGEVPLAACRAASTPTVFPDGRVYACIGPVIDLPSRHPLFLGSVREKPLARVLDEAEHNLVLHLLRVWGPSKLMTLLADRGLSARLPTQFVKHSICNLCYALFSNPALCAALMKLSDDTELVEETAYARLYYLNESRMAERVVSCCE